MFRPWRSFPTMVALGLVLGLLTGGFPLYAREVAQIALVLAMTFSLTEIAFARLSLRAELRGFLLAASMNYGLLSGLLLLYAAASPDPSVRDGWVIMAAAPPAAAVVPITSLLDGDVRRSLLSSAFLYLLGLLLVPAITVAFAGQEVPPTDLAVQTVLLLGVPLLLSRPLRRWRRAQEARSLAIGLSFLVLVMAIAGSTRDTLLGNPGILGSLSALSFLRTFGLGLLLFGVARALRVSPEAQIAAITFSSFKNLGLTIVLAFSFFGAPATLPSIVSLVFEILWIAALPVVFRRGVS